MKSLWTLVALAITACSDARFGDDRTSVSESEATPSADAVAEEVERFPAGTPNVSWGLDVNAAFRDSLRPSFSGTAWLEHEVFHIHLDSAWARKADGKVEWKPVDSVVVDRLKPREALAIFCYYDGDFPDVVNLVTIGVPVGDSAYSELRLAWRLNQATASIDDAPVDGLECVPSEADVG